MQKRPDRTGPTNLWSWIFVTYFYVRVFLRYWYSFAHVIGRKFWQQSVVCAYHAYTALPTRSVSVSVLSLQWRKCVTKGGEGAQQTRELKTAFTRNILTTIKVSFMKFAE